jgi:hypothetical protein
MESTAPSGRIQVSERAHARLQALYDFESRDPVNVRGRGEMATWLLKGRKQGMPSGVFHTPREPAAPELASQLQSRRSVTRRDDQAA